MDSSLPSLDEIERELRAVLNAAVLYGRRSRKVTRNDRGASALRHEFFEAMVKVRQLHALASRNDHVCWWNNMRRLLEGVRMRFPQHGSDDVLDGWDLACAALAETLGQDSIQDMKNHSPSKVRRARQGPRPRPKR